MQAIEDAVDEGRGVGRAVAPGQRDRLIEGDIRRGLGNVEQLVGTEPQGVAIDGGHAHQPPILRGLRQPPINVILMGNHAVIQTETERRERFIAQTIVNEALEYGTVDPLVEVALKEQLQGHFTGTRASGHGWFRHPPFPSE
jgi:hypothetical protein